MKTKITQIITVLFWIIIGLWYIPVLFAEFGQGINCGGMLPDGTLWDGFCVDSYFLNYWWLITIRIFIIGAAIWGLAWLSKSPKYKHLYPYAVCTFLSLSIIIKYLGDLSMLPLAIIVSVLFFAILSSPWWGSKIVLRVIENKIKKRGAKSNNV